MSNTFGVRFRVTTFGESHGPAVGAVVDGCPAGLPFGPDEVAAELARDLPCPEVATARREPNDVELLSGLWRGRTLGTPVAMLIRNRDVDSAPYRRLEGAPRPGHGDLTWHLRYGHVDPRGGGRSSGRECVARLAAGALAKALIGTVGVEVRSRVIELAGVAVARASDLKKALAEAQRLGLAGRTTGGVVRVEALAVPAGLGEPVFGKLQADLAAALFSIGGVRAMEVGDGAALARATGDVANDAIVWRRGGPALRTNRCGGVLGGISTGGPLVMTLAVKPTPSHGLPQDTVDLASGRRRRVRLHGRHDLNFAPRVAVVAEAMVALVVADHLLQSGVVDPVRLPRGKGRR